MKLADVVVIEERRAHAGAVVEDTGLCRNILERHLAVAPSEVAI
jgi:hypothetical protein